MNIIQMTPTIVYGDAVSNDVLAIDKLLKENGYDTSIYVQNIGKLIPDGSVNRYSKEKLEKEISPEDVILYHGSTGTSINEDLKDFSCKKIMRYHNITPAHFFKEYAPITYKLVKEGIRQIENLKNVIDGAIADSYFNAQDLKQMGYKCNIDVCPILIPFEDYRQEPDNDVRDKYNDGYTNILFVGRIVPNKKIEDVIASFCAYKKHYNKKSRLILVGSNEMDIYYQKLKDYIKALDVEDVIFSGHISFAQILAYYSIADLFLCMSEHEGFCVPLVEAMVFRIPIIAYNSSAVGETLSSGGLLIETKKPAEVAECIDYVLTNTKIKKTIKLNQEKRLDELEYGKVKNRFLQILNSYI